MTKRLLTKRILHEFPEMSERQLYYVVDAVVDEMRKMVENEHRVCFREFGTFERRQRKPFEQYNHLRGGNVSVKSRAVIHFKPSKNLLKKVNR